MAQPLCPHCLQPLPAGFVGSCPHCSHTLRNENPEGALPFGTQLGGRYTVGDYVSADGDGLAYRGVCNEDKSFVLIKEYFPVTLCNGRNPDGSLMPKEGSEVLFKTSRMDFKDLFDDLHGLTPCTGLSTVLDVLEENNTVYAIEENAKGMTLTHYLSLRSRSLTPAEARTLLQPVMEGVALLHKSGLIHRGVCPDNILLPIDGTARLSGYGTLALRTGGSELKTQLFPGYAAPEQYAASEFSGRYTDVYALAAVVYRLVTGQTPVAAPQRKVRDSMESAHSLEAGVPTWFSQVVACAMRLDPSRRMQTVPELMSALTDPGVANAMFERGDNQVSTGKIMGAALVVIFVLVALLLWSLLQPGRDEPSAQAAPQSTAAASAGEGSTDPDHRVVPDLVGLRYTTEIKDSDLYTGFRIVMTEQNSSEIPAGCVISQDPAPGTLAEGENSILSLVVSKGPNLVEMPNIIGYTQANAAKLLETLGIRYVMAERDNDGSYAPGCVMMTDYVAGTKFDSAKVVVSVFMAGEAPEPTETPLPTDASDEMDSSDEEVTSEDNASAE